MMPGGWASLPELISSGGPPHGETSIFVMLAIAIPALGALVAALAAKNPRLRNAAAIAGAAGGLGALIPVVLSVRRAGAVAWALPSPLVTPQGLVLRFDGVGSVFACLVALVWLAASVYSLTYMSHERNQARYFGFLLITLAATIGIAGAGTFVTLLVFFEMMSLTSYVLVVHSESPEAYRAGNTYLYMGAFGGLSLLAGVVALQHYLGTTDIAPSAAALEGLAPAVRWTIVALLCTGFGIKAGAVPLHVWLPQAHPVAPSPASALLSGIMIKAGAFGILRTINMLLAPGPSAAGHAAWSLAHSAGFVMIWVGVATMLTGVILALLQENAKRMLAYHSISQMGYILLGVGTGAYLGAEGAVGFAGASLHLINHALFKACLFLAVGAVLLKTGEVNMYKLGGMWRYMPFTALACLVAAAGISGIPGFNGYASKTLLHHAIVEAAHTGGAGLALAEKLFVLTSGGTAASFIKLFGLVFLGKAPERHRRAVFEETPLKLGMAILVVGILAIGLWPSGAVRNVIVPSTGGFSYDHHAVEHLAHVQFFTWPDLRGSAVAVALGALIFTLGMRTGLFHLHGPRWMSVEYLVLAAASFAGRLWVRLVDAWVAGWTIVRSAVARSISRAAELLPALDYAPGQSETAREFSLLNLDFDFFLVLAVIAVSLVLVFATSHI